MKTIITITNEDMEMALMFVDDRSVFFGNFWDFHSGCLGTEIGGFELEGKWDRGIDSLANALADCYKEQGETVETLDVSVEDENLFWDIYGDKLSPSEYIADNPTATTES